MSEYRINRQEFSKHTKLAAWQRCGGVCECGCGVKIIAGDGPEYDHIIEAALGGDNSLDNCRVLRKRCHGAKTSERAAPVAKAKRGFEKRIGARVKKSRPMPGSKASGWKKTFRHGTVRRQKI